VLRDILNQQLFHSLTGTADKLIRRENNENHRVKECQEGLTRSAAEPRRECPVRRLRPRAGGEQRSGSDRAAGRRAARAEGRHGAGDVSAAAGLKAAMGGSGASLIRFASLPPDAAEEEGERVRERGASLSGGPDAPRRPAVLREPSLGGSSAEQVRSGQVGLSRTDRPVGTQQCHRGRRRSSGIWGSLPAAVSPRVWRRRNPGSIESVRGGHHELGARSVLHRPGGDPGLGIPYYFPRSLCSSSFVPVIANFFLSSASRRPASTEIGNPMPDRARKMLTALVTLGKFQITARDLLQI